MPGNSLIKKKMPLKYLCIFDSMREGVPWSSNRQVLSNVGVAGLSE